MKIIKIIPETITDGEGLRMSIYVSGCKHHCFGCHNPQTWDFKIGTPFTKEKLKQIIADYKKNPLLNGITFSGGDPLETENAIDLQHILRDIKKEGINIWCYTGHLYENLVLMTPQRQCLKYIDVLVDGPFINELKNPNLKFRGSSNQRILYLRPDDITDTGIIYKRQ